MSNDFYLIFHGHAAISLLPIPPNDRATILSLICQSEQGHASADYYVHAFDFEQACEESFMEEDEVWASLERLEKEGLIERIGQGIWVRRAKIFEHGWNPE